MMRIAETFVSLQGEGRLTGTRSYFVRVSGCHLHCGYCDTAYACAAEGGEARSVESLLEESLAGDCLHAVVTGGEPMLYPETVALTEGLARRGMHVTVETSGTLYLPVTCDLMSISPKLSNSIPAPHFGPRRRRRHEERRFVPEVLARLMAEYETQLKFVIARPADCDEVLECLNRLSPVETGRVLLMPEGTELKRLEAIRRWLEPYCDIHGFTFCPRRHIEWFGTGRGV